MTQLAKPDPTDEDPGPPSQAERPIPSAPLLRLEAFMAGMKAAPAGPPEEGTPEPAPAPLPEDSAPEEDSATDEDSATEPGDPGHGYDASAILGILSSSEWQKRLDEARAQRDRIQSQQAHGAPQDPPPEPPEEETQGESGPPMRWSGETALVAVSPAGPPAPPRPSPNTGPGGSLVAIREQPPPQPERRSRGVQGLLVGLVAGLSLGAGLTWLATSEPPDRIAAASPETPQPPSDAVSGEDASPQPAGPPPPPQTRSVLVTLAPPPPQTRSVLVTLAPPPLDPPSRPAPAPPVEEEGPLGVTNAVQTSAETPAGTPDAPPPQVALHLSPDLPQEAVEEVRAALGDAGFALQETSVSTVEVPRNQVLFFHPEDAAHAERLAEALGARLRDFSGFTPAPPKGWLEAWLAEDG